eukprot:TRINITY_DN3859_c0_g1_i1.p1 TRINITY_DN3859_c0_g1~~TRINITY_DN3859_c0_g1_i1.p1  ORF type:complete len:226 (+),score=41.59 TRINITY_DN3859_c0_g1_i1:80-679(+)
MTKPGNNDSFPIVATTLQNQNNCTRKIEIVVEAPETNNEADLTEYQDIRSDWAERHTSSSRSDNLEDSSSSTDSITPLAVDSMSSGYQFDAALDSSKTTSPLVMVSSVDKQEDEDDVLQDQQQQQQQQVQLPMAAFSTDVSDLPVTSVVTTWSALFYALQTFFSLLQGLCTRGRRRRPSAAIPRNNDEDLEAMRSPYQM